MFDFGHEKKQKANKNTDKIEKWFWEKSEETLNWRTRDSVVQDERHCLVIGSTSF